MTPELERFIKGEVIIEEGPMPPELALKFEHARRNLLWVDENVERLEVYKRRQGHPIRVNWLAVECRGKCPASSRAVPSWVFGFDSFQHALAVKLGREGKGTPRQSA